MPRLGVLDVGTNSVKLLVAEPAPSGTWTPVLERSEVTRLGEGLQRPPGCLSSVAMDRTLATLEALAAEARTAGAREILAVGTMGLRTAVNSGEFVEAVRARTGIGIRVLPGMEEARLAYLAVQADLPPAAGPVAVFDTGGGSTQFTFGHGNQIRERFSLDVGAVRLTETFRLEEAVAPRVIREVLDGLLKEFARLDAQPTPDAMVGLGGAVTTLASVRHGLPAFDPRIIRNTSLDSAELDRQIELYQSRPAAARRDIPGLPPQRAGVILAGACVVRTILGKLRCPALRVSDRGLRHGVLLDPDAIRLPT